MEWRLPHNRILRIDISWSRARKRSRMAAREPDPEVLEAVRRTQLKAYREYLERREAEGGT